MGKIVAVEYVTLDGVFEDPSWSGPYFNDATYSIQAATRGEGIALARRSIIGEDLTVIVLANAGAPVEGLSPTGLPLEIPGYIRDVHIADGSVPYALHGKRIFSLAFGQQALTTQNDVSERAAIGNSACMKRANASASST